MKNWKGLVLIMCSVNGCTPDTTTSVGSFKSAVGPATLRRSSVSRIVSPEEAALIERIVVTYVPEALRADFRAKLRSGRAILRLNDPFGQTLVDSLQLLRARVSGGRAKNLLGAERRPVSRTDLVPATIALVPSIPEPGARAVVLRRSTGQPSDIILVTKSTENRDLRNALVALFAARAGSGAIAKTDVRLPIRALQSSAAARFRAPSSDVINWDALKSAEMQDLPGIGQARTMVVQLRTPTGGTR